MTEQEELRALLKRIRTQPQDGWIVACLHPDGVQEAAVGTRHGISESRSKVALSILLADLLEQTSERFGEDPDELLERVQRYLDDEEEMLRDLVDNGDLPPRFHPDGSDGSDGDDGDDGGANIPIQ